jgi:hypothetical protein
MTQRRSHRCVDLMHLGGVSCHLFSAILSEEVDFNERKIYLLAQIEVGYTTHLGVLPNTAS